MAVAPSQSGLVWWGNTGCDRVVTYWDQPTLPIKSSRVEGGACMRECKVTHCNLCSTSTGRTLYHPTLLLLHHLLMVDKI